MSNCFRPFLKIILKSYFVVKFLCRELYRWNRLEAADLWREALRTPRSRHRPPPPGPFVFPEESGPVKQRLPAPPRPPGATATPGPRRPAPCGRAALAPRRGAAGRGHVGLPCTFCSSPFIYIYTLSPVPQCLDFCTFTGGLAIGEEKSYSFVLCESCWPF